jgi:hypothetical protein
MSEITLSEETHTRVVEFKQVVEAVIGEELSLEECVELIIAQGIDSMVAGLLEPLDQATLLTSFQQLGSQYPAQLYRYIADTLSQGTVFQEQQKKMQKQLGFQGGSERNSR